MRRTKIIASIGPASESPAAIASLIDAGVDVARLNASHGGIDELERRLEVVRAVAAEKSRHVAVLLDVPGPKIRLGEMQSLALHPGEPFSLFTSGPPPESAGPAAASAGPCDSCETLVEELSVGDVLVIGDGETELRVTALTKDRIDTITLAGGDISSRKGLTARGVSLPLPPVTPEDEEIIRWGVSAGVDAFAQSFVRVAEDIDAFRAAMGGAAIPVIAKIERPEAVDVIDEIVSRVDGVMVARGDLGVAAGPEYVPVYQKRIVAAARSQGRPVIIATQMLESMIGAPRPTRAEASDVANAVFDAVDAVMLSGETAVGRFPTEAVATMARIATIAEESAWEGVAARETPTPHGPWDVPWAVSASVCELANQLQLAAIVTATQSGASARMVAAQRPRTQIVAVTPDEAVARRLALVWGVRAVVVHEPGSIEELTTTAAGAALEAGYAAGDLVAIVAGVAVNQPGSTDTIQVRKLG